MSQSFFSEKQHSPPSPRSCRVDISLLPIIAQNDFETNNASAGSEKESSDRTASASAGNSSGHNNCGSETTYGAGSGGAGSSGDIYMKDMPTHNTSTNSNDAKNNLFEPRTRRHSTNELDDKLRAQLAAMKADDNNRAEIKSSRHLNWSKFKWPTCDFGPTMELRDINLTELAEKKLGPGFRFKDLEAQDQVQLITEALSSTTFLIDPQSDYMKFWDIVIVLCLVFTALVTPYEIAFREPNYDHLYIFNRLVDLLFVKDMVMQFFLKIMKTTKQGKVWVRSKQKIASVYIRSWFVIDFFSIVPYDDITTLLTAGASSTGLQKLKIMRMLRVFRLVKLIRIIKASRIIKRMENRIDLMSSTKYLINFTILISVACHWMACIWGFLGIMEGSNLVCRRDLLVIEPNDERLTRYPDRRYFFAEDDALDPFNPSQWTGRSWIVNFAEGRAAQTPADPCDSSMLYLASIYWAIMTMTSIGYGDIVPVTFAEYVVCSFCMMGSSILWAYIIGAACAVMSNLNPEQTEFERRLDAFNSMARAQTLPKPIQQRGREYLREERLHQGFLRNRAAVQQLGKDLRGIISRQMASHYLDNIWFFRNTSDQLREDVAHKFVPHFYDRREIIAQLGKLCVVERGAVGRVGRILVPWGYWGDDFLLRDALLQNRYFSVALSFTEIVTLDRDDLNSVLVEYPLELRAFRRAAGTIALARAVRVYKEEIASGQRLRENTWLHALFDSVGAHAMPRAKGATEKARHTSLARVPMIGETKLTQEEQLESVLETLGCMASGAPGAQANQKVTVMQEKIQRIEASQSSLMERATAAAAAAVAPTTQQLIQLQAQMDRIEKLLVGGGVAADEATHASKAPSHMMPKPYTERSISECACITPAEPERFIGGQHYRGHSAKERSFREGVWMKPAETESFHGGPNHRVQSESARLGSSSGMHFPVGDSSPLKDASDPRRAD